MNRTHIYLTEAIDRFLAEARPQSQCAALMGYGATAPTCPSLPTRVPTGIASNRAARGGLWRGYYRALHGVGLADAIAATAADVKLRWSCRTPNTTPCSIPSHFLTAKAEPEVLPL